MNAWELIDCLEALDEDQENPRLPIHSESQLRDELHRLAQRPPGLVYLAGPDRDRLAISIGGPLAALGWAPPPLELQRIGAKVALPQRIARPTAVDFVRIGAKVALPQRIARPTAVDFVAEGIDTYIVFYVA